jgi:3-oxoacyl-[acyl-carrier protein] reductase
MPGTVLITGASRGLGEEIADKFSKEKWNVIPINSKNCGITDRASIKNLFKSIHNLDVVINNAGINKDQLLFRTTAEDWNKIIDVNLTGVFNICREAVKIMRHTGGHIVNISSMAGVTGRGGQCAYSASKAGLIGFSKALAKETARWNIKVNVILPGYMKTYMASEGILERGRQENILNKINEPTDITKFIFQLAQTDFISGQVFNLDSRIFK